MNGSNGSKVIVKRAFFIMILPMMIFHIQQWTLNIEHPSDKYIFDNALAFDNRFSIFLVCLSILGTHEILRSNSIGVWQLFSPLEQYVAVSNRYFFLSHSFQFHLHHRTLLRSKTINHVNKQLLCRTDS